MPALKVYDGTTWQYLNGGTAPPIRLGYAQVVANQASITTTTDLTGLTATVNVAAGRTIKITAHIRAAGTNNDNIAELHIQEGGTVLALDRVYLGSTASGLKTLHAEVVLTPTAASHTYKLTLEMSTGAGSVSLAAGATFPAFILVEDITGGSGSLDTRDFDQKLRTAGNISTSSTSFVDIDTALDLVITAAAGDWLEVGVNGVWSNQAIFGRMEAFTWVGGATVNAVSGASNGVPAWLGAANTYQPIGASLLYLVQAGDVSSGTVTLRFRYKVDSATAKTLHAEAVNPLRVWARNLGVPPA